MEKSDLVLLPGLKQQIRFLIQKSDVKQFSNALVIGSGSEATALKIAGKFESGVEIIVQDYESLINSKYLLGNSSGIEVKMMSFDSTDYEADRFDLVYAQASISLTNRNKIVKETGRILKPGGQFCVGEVVSLQKEVPRFVKDIYDSSDLLPLNIEKIENYYTGRGYSIIGKADLSSSLKEYYSMSRSAFEEISDSLDKGEQSYYKKIINRIKHESNAYLKLGGDKFIGFVALLLKKEKN